MPKKSDYEIKWGKIKLKSGLNSSREMIGCFLGVFVLQPFIVFLFRAKKSDDEFELGKIKLRPGLNSSRENARLFF